MTRPMTRRRRGASAVELLLASAILASAFVPIYVTMTSSRRSAFLNAMHVLARRRAYRALNWARGQPYDAVRAAATGAAPPADLPSVPAGGKEIPLALPDGEAEVALEDAPAKMLLSYRIRVDRMPTHLYFEELSPGLARLTATVQWEDPTNKAPRSFVATTFMEHPTLFRGRTR